jgi:ComF family protein
MPYPGNISEAFECSQCLERRPKFDFARASVVATDLVVESVVRHKYNGAVWVEPFLVELLLNGALKSLRPEHFDYVVPVPLHPLRLRERGFNQAERLARPLAKALNVPLNDDILERVKNTETQTTLDKKKRAENMKDAFTANLSLSIKSPRILLVDDILTTGVTADACAQALRKQGASRVAIWTVARRVRN